MTKLQPFAVTASMSEESRNAAISAAPNSDLQDIARYVALIDNVEVINVDGSSLTNRVLNTCGIIIKFRGRTRDGEDLVLTSDDLSHIMDKISGGNTYVEGFDASMHAEGSVFVLTLKSDSNQTK